MSDVPVHDEMPHELQLASAFAIGFIFGPFSWSLLSFVIFCICYEILFVWWCECKHWNHCIGLRLALNYVGAVGWFCGRWSYHGDLESEVLTW